MRANGTNKPCTDKKYTIKTFPYLPQTVGSVFYVIVITTDWLSIGVLFSVESFSFLSFSFLFHLIN